MVTGMQESSLVTGIDLLEISRMRRSMQSPRFMTRVFSVKEQALFGQKGKGAAASAAANFAAKEAFSKAMGTGVRGFALPEVQLLRDELGKPYLELTGKALAMVQAKGLELSVSVSHTQEYACAVVVGLRRKTEGGTEHD